MHTKNRICILLLWLGGLAFGFAQEVLTVDEAVKIALENNYQIKTARNDLKIDELGVSPGQAGMLPQLGANLTDNNSVQSLTQVRNDGTVQDRDNVKNSSFNYGVALEWTIFDGFSMFANFEQLKETQKLGEAELKQAILTKVGEIMITYYDLVQQQQQLSALDSTLSVSYTHLTLPTIYSV